MIDVTLAFESQGYTYPKIADVLAIMSYAMVLKRKIWRKRLIVKNELPLDSNIYENSFSARLIIFSHFFKRQYDRVCKEIFKVSEISKVLT